MYKLEPYSDRILVKKILIEAKSQGGIILSVNEAEDEKDLSWGRVLSVGEGKQVDTLGKLPMKTKIGDIIAFNTRIPTRFHYKGEYLYILRETDVLLNNKDEDIVEKPYEAMSSMSSEPRYIG